MSERKLNVAELMQFATYWQRNLYDLDWAGTLDEPSPEPTTQLSFEEYVQSFYLAPRFLPEANFIALDGDEYVGLSAALEWMETALPAGHALRSDRLRLLEHRWRSGQACVSL